MKPYTFGSLFAGIGGLDLGFERAGFRCLWQVEIDPFCQRVLAKHWPNVRRHTDVRTFTGDDYEKPDIIIGGFPCQDVSLAGNRAGLAGERSGLWFEFARIVRTLRPRFVVVENVPGLLAYDRKKGLAAPVAAVLAEFSELGFDAEWSVVSARSMGSTQLRKRVFIIAYACGERNGSGQLSTRSRAERQRAFDAERAGEITGMHADANGTRSPLGDGERGDAREAESTLERVRSVDGTFLGSGWWEAEPPLARMVYGVPGRLVRDPIRALGNCVIPQVAEHVAMKLRELIEVAGNQRAGGVVRERFPDCNHGFGNRRHVI